VGSLHVIDEPITPMESPELPPAKVAPHRRPLEGPLPLEGLFLVGDVVERSLDDSFRFSALHTPPAIFFFFEGQPFKSSYSWRRPTSRAASQASKPVAWPTLRASSRRCAKLLSWRRRPSRFPSRLHDRSGRRDDAPEALASPTLHGPGPLQ
jgi:hypothetical protein